MYGVGPRFRATISTARDYQLTLSVTAGILVVYAVQLLLAGSLKSGAAYTVANSVPIWAYLLVGPWLHSNHAHLAWNLGSFLILSGWSERQVGTKSCLVLIAVMAYATTVLPTLVGFNRGVGISGMTNTLLPAFAGFQLIECSRQSVTVPAEFRQSGRIGLSDALTVAKHGVLFVFSASLLIQSAGEGFGFRPQRLCVAAGSHAAGLVAGIFSFAYLAVDSYTTCLE